MPRLEFPDSPVQQAYRVGFRRWLEAALPGGWVEALRSGDRAVFTRARRGWDEVSFHRAMGRAGYLGVSWPPELGGQGLSWIEETILAAEMARVEVPLLGLRILGVGLAGPTIMRWGTDEQRRELLPGIASGAHIWCQLFSEPGAGSDLAAVTTRGVGDGGGFVITGQKVWTSLAQHANYGMLVARTDPSVPKHRGLTWFAAPLRNADGKLAKGVEIRPLRMMTGDAVFNEVFLDGFRVPERAVIGGVGNGWDVVRTTLANERFTLAGDAFEPAGGVRGTIELARELHRAEEPVMRQRLAQLYIESEVKQMTLHRSLLNQLAGRPPGPADAVGKLAMARYNQRKAELELELLGPAGLLRSPGRSSGPGRLDDVAFTFLRSRANSIEGGTSEVVRNVVAERVLGLPREPDLDRDVPFSRRRGGER